MFAFKIFRNFKHSTFFLYKHTSIRNKSCDNPVKCKAVIITGGAGGIGLSIAKAFLSNEAKGVILGDINEKAGQEAVCTLSKEFGDDKVAFTKCDVTKKNQLQQLFKCCSDRYESVDIVVNNAGILQFCKWEKEININLVSLIGGTLQALQCMGKQNDGFGGYVINVASILGLQYLSGCPVYTGTKHGVIGWSRSIGNCFYEKLTGVKILTICPGVTDTNLIAEAKQYGLKDFPNVGDLLAQQLGELKSQSPDVCGCHVIEMLKKGKSGSLWISEANELYEIKIPDVCEMKVTDDC